MSALLWWLVPIVATVIAAVWVSWVNRPKPPADVHDTLKAHHRFTEAMERQTGQGAAHRSASPDEPDDGADRRAERAG